MRRQAWITLLFKWIRGEGWSYRFSLWPCDRSKYQLSVCLINAGDTNLVNDLLLASQGCQYLVGGELILINSQNHLLLTRGVLVLALNPKALKHQRTDRLRWFTICTSSKGQFTKFSLFSYIKCIYYLSSLGIKYRYFENILPDYYFFNKSVAHLIFIGVLKEIKCGTFTSNSQWESIKRIYCICIIYVFCRK